eukprot:sb/3474270/
MEIDRNLLRIVSHITPDWLPQIMFHISYRVILLIKRSRITYYDYHSSHAPRKRGLEHNKLMRRPRISDPNLPDPDLPEPQFTGRIKFTNYDKFFGHKNEGHNSKFIFIFWEIIPLIQEPTSKAGAKQNPNLFITWMLVPE